MAMKPSASSMWMDSLIADNTVTGYDRDFPAEHLLQDHYLQ
jgi:hypothetical protein